MFLSRVTNGVEIPYEIALHTVTPHIVGKNKFPIFNNDSTNFSSSILANKENRELILNLLLRPLPSHYVFGKRQDITNQMRPNFQIKRTLMNLKGKGTLRIFKMENNKN